MHGENALSAVLFVELQKKRSGFRKAWVLDLLSKGSELLVQEDHIPSFRPARSEPNWSLVPRNMCRCVLLHN